MTNIYISYYYKRVVKKLREERKIAYDDNDVATSPEDAQYYTGIVDGVTQALQIMREELKPK